MKAKEDYQGLVYSIIQDGIAFDIVNIARETKLSKVKAKEALNKLMERGGITYGAGVYRLEEWDREALKEPAEAKKSTAKPRKMPTKALPDDEAAEEILRMASEL